MNNINSKLINMKKLFLILACTSVGLMSVNAQESIVKEVEKELVTSTDYAGLRSKLQPALENEVSSKDAYSWYVASRVELKNYDDLYKIRVINPAGVDVMEMGSAILKGYDYMLKALPLDTLPEIDKKTGEPKVDKKTGEVKLKTKYSSKIVSSMGENYGGLYSLSYEFFNARDYDKAIKAFDLLVTLPKKSYMKGKVVELPDSTLGEIRFLQAYAMWQNDQPKESLKIFQEARDLGYKKKDAFDVPFYVASQLQDIEALKLIAKEAIPLYGSEDSQFIRILINIYLNDKNYDEANAFLDAAINNDPQNAEFMNLKGSLVEHQSSIEEALPYFQKAAELDPTFAKAYFDLGRYYFNKAVETRDANSDLFGAALEAKVNPLYEQALPYLEKAYELDSSNIDVKNALRNIYYMLGNEDKLNAIENQ